MKTNLAISRNKICTGKVNPYKTCGQSCVVVVVVVAVLRARTVQVLFVLHNFTSLIQWIKLII